MVKTSAQLAMQIMHGKVKIVTLHLKCKSSNLPKSFTCCSRNISRMNHGFQDWGQVFYGEF